MPQITYFEKLQFVVEVTFKVKEDKWKQGQKNKTKTQTEDKENAEADDVRYQFLS